MSEKCKCGHSAEQHSYETSGLLKPDCNECACKSYRPSEGKPDSEPPTCKNCGHEIARCGNDGCQWRGWVHVDSQSHQCDAKANPFDNPASADAVERVQPEPAIRHEVLKVVDAENVELMNAPSWESIEQEVDRFIDTQPGKLVIRLDDGKIEAIPVREVKRLMAAFVRERGMRA